MIVVLKEVSEKICEIKVDSDNADFIKNSSGLYESLDDLINEINETAIVQGIDEGKSAVKYISVTNIIDNNH